MPQGKSGLALAGGGPLGAIYEIGALVALDEALIGLDLAACDVYVGVSSGSFFAAGLANDMTPRELYRLFIETEAARNPFEPNALLHPAVGEYLRRLASAPGLFAGALRRSLDAPLTDSFQRMARALPTGIFDNSRLAGWLAQHFSAPGRTNDFRELSRKLFLVATDLDASEAVAFGSAGWNDVPISRAVQASSALPGLFPPVDIGGRHYVDGALTKTLHASVALKEGVDLLFCINPLVPFDDRLAPPRRRHQPLSLVEGGLPVVLSQTFRAIIHSRMRIGMERYRHQYPKADIVLFEPSGGDADMFFTNVFSYSSRKRLSEHAYQFTREELRRRSEELAPVLARHGIMLDKAALEDENRRLTSPARRRKRGRGWGGAGQQLDRSLLELEKTLGAIARRG
jgi:NTE family protein